MAEVEQSTEEGAPVAEGTIDPELIRLTRARPKVSVITAAGLVFLCAFFSWKLNADRRFSGSDTKPTKVTVESVLAGNVGLDTYIQLDAEPLMAHAIRSTTAKGSLGFRVTPARGTAERLWLVLPGDGWEQPAQGGYVGRLRVLADLPFAPSVAEYAAAHPRPMFATAAETRAGLATGKVKTVSGDTVAISEHDRVAFDVVDPNVAVIVGTLNEPRTDLAAWRKALEAAGITPSGAPQVTAEQVKFDVSLSNAVPTLTSKLEAAKLFARVDPVTRHYETTWSALVHSSPAGFTVEGATIPDAQLDLIGLYVAREIPSGAYALITGERPDDYWYVFPVTVVVGLIGVLFAWALVRAVKRDLLPTRA